MKWKELEDLAIILKRKDIKIPKHIMEDLKSANILIKTYIVDKKYTETASRIDEYLRNVSACLLSLAESNIGKEFAEKWFETIEGEQELQKQAVSPKIKTKFITGIPRNEHWFRVQISQEMDQEYLEKLASSFKLSYKIQDDRFLLIHGDEEKIKNLIRKIAKKIKK